MLNIVNFTKAQSLVNMIEHGDFITYSDLGSESRALVDAYRIEENAHWDAVAKAQQAQDDMNFRLHEQRIAALTDY